MLTTLNEMNISNIKFSSDPGFVISKMLKNNPNLKIIR